MVRVVLAMQVLSQSLPQLVAAAVQVGQRVQRVLLKLQYLVLILPDRLVAHTAVAVAQAD
jgi:hypothetical protein